MTKFKTLSDETQRHIIGCALDQYTTGDCKNYLWEFLNEEEGWDGAKITRFIKEYGTLIDEIDNNMMDLLTEALLSK